VLRLTAGLALAATAGAMPVVSPGASAAAAPDAPVYGGHLTVAGEAEVTNAWNPATMQCDQYCTVRARTFFDQLALLDERGDPQPMLAESFTPNDDFSEWTIALRPGIRFTDGTPVDAEAVVYNLQQAGSGLLLGAALSDVAKVPDPDDPSRQQLKIEVVDDLTFVVYLGRAGDPEQPSSRPRFPAAFATQWGFIASQRWLESLADDPGAAARPIGSGPFMVESYAPGESLELVRNPDYWGTDADGNQLPYLDGMTFRVIEDSEVAADALEHGDIDVVTTSASGVIADHLDDPSVTVHEQFQFSDTIYLLIDLDKPGPLQDRRVRCALSMAIDRQELIDATSGGLPEPANGLFSPGQEGHLDDNGLSIEQDLDGAAALIEEYEAETGNEVSIDLGHTPPGDVQALAELLMGFWSEIGVEVHDAVIPQNDFITLALFGDPAFEIFIWRNHAGSFVTDQYIWWHSANAAPDGQLALNFGRLHDPDVDAALDAARAAVSPDQGEAAAEQVNRTFAEHCYQIPLWWTPWAVITGPDVRGYGDFRLPGVDQALRESAGQFFTAALWRAEG